MYYVLLTIHFHDIWNTKKNSDCDTETTIIAVSEHIKALQNITSEWNSIKKSVLDCIINKDEVSKPKIIELLETFFNKYPAEKSDKIMTKLCKLLSMNIHTFHACVEYSNITIHKTTLVNIEESKE